MARKSEITKDRTSGGLPVAAYAQWLIAPRQCSCCDVLWPRAVRPSRRKNLGRKLRHGRRHSTLRLAEEVRQAISPIGYYFGRSAVKEDQTKRFARVLPVERVYAAWEGGRAVGGLAARPLH